ncbi:MAG: DNA mismatch repair endonuclease MutL [Lachnospiraceae bacterium]|nr:DNA mismatch repair endonuclease MutL [Lachnospiraceae bacterium]
MPEIHFLEQSTIDKIAAGEVVERPSSIVKELVENAIDAGATAITVEIRDGGISFIRITDNGCGISREEVPMAFLRHSTSKIRTVEDLAAISSLGFRGEALSSIAAVSQVELITKTGDALTASRYVIEGSKEIKFEEIGAPNGTTFLVRNLFYNTPARQKFLKSPQTEAGYINDFMERLALSKPEISFQFISNNQPKLSTSGNGDLKEVIYRIYGRDIAMNLIEIHEECAFLKLDGFLGKPVISRGNRNFESYFVNGRYVKDKIVSKAIETAYKLHLMQHQYPFAALNLKMDGSLLDINVHPAKMELRFSNGSEVYDFLNRSVQKALSQGELIPEVSVAPANRGNDRREKKGEGVSREFKNQRSEVPVPAPKKDVRPEPFEQKRLASLKEEGQQNHQLILKETAIYEKPFLEQQARARHRVIGQVFDTYWLVQFEEKLFIIDQHAAHEKVLFERLMRDFKKKDFTSQQISPPIVVSLNMREEELLKKYREEFQKLGYEIESFGGKEYAICAVPGNLYNLSAKDLFIEMLDELSDETGRRTSDAIIEKIASMSCKAAVKGKQHLSSAEIEKLLDKLLSCENPYQCPHGRPTIISMTKYELEKKFKRII